MNVNITVFKSFWSLIRTPRVSRVNNVTAEYEWRIPVISPPSLTSKATKIESFYNFFFLLLFFAFFPVSIWNNNKARHSTQSERPKCLNVGVKFLCTSLDFSRLRNSSALALNKTSEAWAVCLFVCLSLSRGFFQLSRTEHDKTVKGIINPETKIVFLSKHCLSRHARNPTPAKFLCCLKFLFFFILARDIIHFKWHSRDNCISC